MPRLAQAEGRDPRFLVIVLRGALDGLATVVPVGDPNWVRLRGNDALLTSGETAALPLDNFFALNPAMPNLHRMYKATRRPSFTRLLRLTVNARTSTVRTCWRVGSRNPAARAAGSIARWPVLSPPTGSPAKMPLRLVRSRR